jgi:hypothetical protein
MFSISFKDIVNKHILKGNFREFVYMAISPLTSLNIKFKAWKDEKDYELQFNGQTIYLEHVINDQFDNSSRRIYIEDTSGISYQYLYNKIEGRSPIYLYNKSEAATPIYFQNRVEQVNLIHFIVRVPTGMAYDSIKLKALVDRYKIASKNYTVQTY